MEDKNIEKRIKTKQNKLKKLFKDIDENKKNLVVDLIYNASFMSVKLEDLVEYINKNGVKEKYKNGENQFGYKESIESKTYSTLIKNYTNIIKQLSDLLPDNKKIDLKDDFDAFCEDGC